MYAIGKQHYCMQSFEINVFKEEIHTKCQNNKFHLSVCITLQTIKSFHRSIDIIKLHVPQIAEAHHLFMPIRFLSLDMIQQ